MKAAGEKVAAAAKNPEPAAKTEAETALKHAQKELGESKAAVADAKKGQVLDEYPVGTAVIVIGTARDAPYSFVSPCNACRHGFIETAFLQK